MKKKTRLFFISISFATLVIIIVSMVCVAVFSYSVFNKEGALNEKFFGKKAEYEGIINLWNLDTFEGGSASREGYLNYVAMNFEKKFKGALIKVENMTYDEVKANIAMGKKPDIFTFGSGVKLFEESMLELSDEFAKLLLPNFYASGLSGGKLLAAAWAVGGYALLSSTAKIEAAGKEVVSLKDLALQLDYDVTYRKKSKHIYSLTFGKTDYTNAIDVFSRNFDEGIATLCEKNILDPNYNSQSPYQAYLSYINKKSSVLLGTQRDIYRLENRVNAGVDDDVIVYPLKEYTDLVCYASVLQNSNSGLVKTAKEFVKFLVSEGMQQKLSGIGMLSPLGLNLYLTGGMAALNAAITKDTIVRSAF